MKKSALAREFFRAELKGTNGFLQNSAGSSGFLWKAAPPKCCHAQEKQKSAKISENLRETAKLAPFVPSLTTHTP